MEEDEREEQLLVLVLAAAAREGGLADQLVQTLHVGLETLGEGDDNMQYLNFSMS